MLPKRSSLLATFETRLDASMVTEHDDEMGEHENDVDEHETAMACTAGRLKYVE